MRKVLSFVLVLSLVLGSFSMAFAATPSGLSDIDASANKEAIQVNFDLGIITGNPDGTFLPEKAVNRAEFAAMLTRALAIPPSALAGYTSTTFKDTAGYGWAVPYLAFAQSKGIMLGDGQGNAMPGRTINTNEAVTMALRAVGYTNNSSDLVGAWPANYVTKAQDLGLYKDVASALNVDKANAAQLIYNLLTVSKVQVATDGTTTLVNPVANLLTSGLKATVETGIVYYDDPAVINTTAYVGAYATKYLNEDDEIIAIKTKSTFLTGKLNAAKSKFKVGDVEYTVASSVANLTPSALLNNDPQTDILFSAYPADTTYTIAADVSGRTLKEVYSVNEWIVTADERVDSGIQDEIADNELLNFDFAENDDDSIDLNSFALIGVTSLDKIAKDNVVYVYTLGNASNKDIVKVSVGTGVVEGVVTAYNDDDGAKIGGKYYENSDVAVNALAAANVSDTVKVWLDASGKVYDFDVTEGNADNYAVVTGTKTAIGYDSVIKLIDKEGTKKQYTLDSDIASVNPAKGQIVLFGLDKDGVIEAMDVTAAGVKTNNASLLVTGSSLTVKTAKVLEIGSASYRISSDVVVFTYEGSDIAGATDFGTSAIAKVTDDLITQESAVYFDKDGVVTAILVPEADADSSDDDLYGVVNSKELTTNADNDKVWLLKGFAGTADLSKLTTTKAKGDSVDAAGVDGDIRLYKISLNADGDINEAPTLVAATYDAGGTLATASSVTSGEGILVSSAGSGYITNTTLGALAIADNAVFYEVTFKDNGNVDKYSKFSGSVRTGYKVWLYETDDDKAGYDFVIVMK